MTIIIVVEDGSIVDDANSFVSQDDAREYAANRGIALSDDDDVVAAQLIQASDYLNAQENRFVGERVEYDQPMVWPRECAVINGKDFPNNAIPKSLIAAQCALAIAVSQGFSLLSNTSAADYVIREKVGPIETEYADPSVVGIAPTFGAAEALLAPLYGSNNSFPPLRTCRI